MSNHKSRFSRVDLIVCVFVAAFIPAFLVAAISQDTEKSNLAGCQSNLRRIWNGLELYAADYDGVFPPANWKWGEEENIMSFLWPDYVDDKETFHCPADDAYWRPSDHGQSYTYWMEFGRNHYGGELAKVNEPALDVDIWGHGWDFYDLGHALLMHDGEPWISRDAEYFQGVPANYRRHYESKLENCLYLDGHVKVRNTHWPDDNPMNWWVGPWNWKTN